MHSVRWVTAIFTYFLISPIALFPFTSINSSQPSFDYLYSKHLLQPGLLNSTEELTVRANVSILKIKCFANDYVFSQETWPFRLPLTVDTRSWCCSNPPAHSPTTGRVIPQAFTTDWARHARSLALCVERTETTRRRRTRLGCCNELRGEPVAPIVIIKWTGGDFITQIVVGFGIREYTSFHYCFTITVKPYTVKYSLLAAFPH